MDTISYLCSTTLTTIRTLASILLFAHHHALENKPAYAQVLENKPEYTSRVRQVGSNILPVRGSIHSYSTLSQYQSQNPNNSIVSQMAERIKELEVEREQYRAQMEDMEKLIEEQNA